MNKNIYIAFDIGATKILKAIVKLEGRKYDFLDIKEENNPRNSAKIKKMLAEYCLVNSKKYKANKVAVSSSNIVQPKNISVANAKRSCYGAYTFSFEFLRKLGFAVALENDGHCFALGEYNFGKARGAKSVLALTLGTGIGGGFIHEGKNFRGFHFSALEIGRSKIFFKEKWYEWEWVAAGRGIEKFYFDFSKKRAPAKEVFAKAKKGDHTAKKVLMQAQKAFGIGISNLLNIFDPQAVTVGGGMAKQTKFIRGAFVIAQKNCLNKKARYRLLVSALGSKSNLLGAVMNFQNSTKRI